VHFMQYMEAFILWYTLCVMRIRPSFLLSLVFAVFSSISAVAFAADRHLPVGGTTFDFATIAQRIITFLAASITTVASGMFMVGAFMIVLSGAKEDFKQRGKDLMIGSLMSVGVVLGAYAIYRTVAIFLA
jgi:hypothetical protein